MHLDIFLNVVHCGCLAEGRPDVPALDWSGPCVRRGYTCDAVRCGSPDLPPRHGSAEASGSRRLGRRRASQGDPVRSASLCSARLCFVTPHRAIQFFSSYFFSLPAYYIIRVRSRSLPHFSVYRTVCRDPVPEAPGRSRARRGGIARHSPPQPATASAIGQG